MGNEQTTGWGESGSIDDIKTYYDTRFSYDKRSNCSPRFNYDATNRASPTLCDDVDDLYEVQADDVYFTPESFPVEKLPQRLDYQNQTGKDFQYNPSSSKLYSTMLSTIDSAKNVVPSPKKSTVRSSSPDIGPRAWYLAKYRSDAPPSDQDSETSQTEVPQVKISTPGVEDNELVVKARLPDSDDGDFIEVVLDKNIATYQYVLAEVCKALDVDPKSVERLRKLPNTRVRNDRDVERFAEGQELELVVTSGKELVDDIADISISRRKKYRDMVSSLLHDELTDRMEQSSHVDHANQLSTTSVWDSTSYDGSANAGTSDSSRTPTPDDMYGSFPLLPTSGFYEIYSRQGNTGLQRPTSHATGVGAAKGLSGSKAGSLGKGYGDVSSSSNDPTSDYTDNGSRPGSTDNAASADSQFITASDYYKLRYRHPDLGPNASDVDKLVGGQGAQRPSKVTSYLGGHRINVAPDPDRLDGFRYHDGKGDTGIQVHASDSAYESSGASHTSSGRSTGNTLTKSIAGLEDKKAEIAKFCARARPFNSGYGSSWASHPSLGGSTGDALTKRYLQPMSRLGTFGYPGSNTSRISRGSSTVNTFPKINYQLQGCTYPVTTTNRTSCGSSTGSALVHGVTGLGAKPTDDATSWAQSVDSAYGSSGASRTSSGSSTGKALAKTHFQPKSSLGAFGYPVPNIYRTSSRSSTANTLPKMYIHPTGGYTCPDTNANASRLDGDMYAGREFSSRSSQQVADKSSVITSARSSLNKLSELQQDLSADGVSEALQSDYDDIFSCINSLNSDMNSYLESLKESVERDL